MFIQETVALNLILGCIKYAIFTTKTPLEAIGVKLIHYTFYKFCMKTKKAIEITHGQLSMAIMNQLFRKTT